MNRNKLYITAVLALAGLILAPVLESVNCSQRVKAVTVAVGNPLPAPVPRPPAANTVLTAVGNPLPAPVPRPPVIVA